MKWPMLFLVFLGQDSKEDTAILFCSKNIARGKGNFYLYFKISEQELTIRKGDALAYDLFLPAQTTELRGGIDIQFRDGSNLRSSDVKDGDGLAGHGSALLEKAKGAWITRRFDLSSLAGKETFAWDIHCEGDTPGAYVQLLDNIVVEHADGSRSVIYENGRPAVSDVHWREGYSKDPELAVVLRSKIVEGPDLNALIEQEQRRAQLRALAKKHRKELDTMVEILRREGRTDLLKDVDEAVSRMPDPETYDGTAEAYLKALHDTCHKLSHAHPVMANYTGHLVGHAHIDFSWLWNWPEGIEVSRQTFTQATRFMAQYPEFKFSQSSGALYHAMEKHHPKVLAQIKKYIDRGQWEVVGGRWSEGDTNMASEEGHARQFLIAQRYFREKLGVTATVGWEPDTFGHTWQMPQLLRLSGIDSYYFCRAGKNQALFWWEGPDGSRVLAFDEPGLGTDSFYNSDVTPKQFRELLKFNEQYGSKDMMWVYGVGNHGGGPTLENIRTVLEWQKSPYLPRAKFSTAGEFFKNLRDQKLHDVETLRDELNAVHMGCYTSNSRVKRLNRDAEAEAAKAETVAAVASRFGYAYPRATFHEIWRDIAWNHHHDTLPGTSIHSSYDLSYKLYEQGIRNSAAILDAATRTIAEQVQKCEPHSLLVFNTLGWKRSALVCVKPPDGLPEGPLVAESTPVQRTAEGDLIFVAHDLPPFGYRVYRIQKAEKEFEPLRCDGGTVSNGRFDLQLDAATGRLTRLFDKTLNKELASRPLNDLVVHWEASHPWSAWAIGPISKVLRPRTEAKIETIESGPVRVRVRLHQSFDASSWTQDLIVYRDLDWVEFQLNVDWNQKGNTRDGSPFLRALFPLNVPDSKARYAIPYGDIERPQPPGDIADPASTDARQDVAALTWGAVGNSEYGVALLNDCKYGYQAQNGTLRLSLLRASYDPDPIPDVGKHFMRYALLPHAGSIHDARLTRRGFEFNYSPATAWVPSSTRGSLKKEESFLSIEAPNVVPTVIKLSEDGPEWVVRFFESSGKPTEARMKCGFEIDRAERVNLIEDRVADADPASVTLRSYEIQTLKLKFKDPKPSDGSGSYP